ncbi:30S ribosomal protein S4 [bacterium]|nr:30S ribosomal protein S4 [bacterium]MCI0606036.1 30S ribosomal protein S4 [bacterium]
MARYIGPVCRLCRREGEKLFLKGEKCFTKCIIEKRPTVPGQHGRNRRAKLLGYGLQLREKQKVKRLYGLLEKQFRLTFERAEKSKGITGESLLLLLERRLDNILYRLGVAASRKQGRQFVLHGHVTVNGRKVTIPSYTVSPGDVIGFKETFMQNAQMQQALAIARSRGVPVWLELDAEKPQGKLLALPTRQDLTMPIQENLIVELYSK